MASSPGRDGGTIGDGVLKISLFPSPLFRCCKALCEGLAPASRVAVAMRMYEYGR